jgi:glucosyl-dolichyl phosphate glucuronosyltransferase
MDRPIAISVIIPTLNRCSYLERALASAREQTFPSSEYEIIVVDNGSTDGTRDLVERLNQDGGKRLCYVYEGQLGLHHARHAGARAAKSWILIFTDDDATFDPG